ncbi:hypothetical protein [Methylobacterium sp. Leaf106]|uniref:hypothetical protein n=1 Tax=Methylobacterium sp. Leaf106 TaxID=1736255 RepID=UPI0012E75E8D|nr:hypothetical protein [Methylobacterium sp. Leaf106]
MSDETPTPSLADAARAQRSRVDEAAAKRLSDEAARQAALDKVALAWKDVSDRFSRIVSNVNDELEGTGASVSMVKSEFDKSKREASARFTLSREWTPQIKSFLQLFCDYDGAIKITSSNSAIKAHMEGYVSNLPMSYYDGYVRKFLALELK